MPLLGLLLSVLRGLRILGALLHGSNTTRLRVIATVAGFAVLGTSVARGGSLVGTVVLIALCGLIAWSIWRVSRRTFSRGR